MRRNRFDMHDIVDQLIVNNNIVHIHIDIEAFLCQLCVMKRIPNINNKFEYIAVWNAYFPRQKTFIWV